jgi:hypothetical protein
MRGAVPDGALVIASAAATGLHSGRVVDRTTTEQRCAPFDTASDRLEPFTIEEDP